MRATRTRGAWSRGSPTATVLCRTALAGVVAIACGGGCASVGWGFGHASTRVEARPGSASILQSTKQVDYATTYQAIRVVDTSGLLLAGLVNTARQAEARDQAVDRAAAGGAKPGDTVEYSYKGFAPLPGPGVTADLRLGLGPGSTSFPGAGGFRYESTNYVGFDIGAEPIVTGTPDGKFAAAFGFAMLLEMWGLTAPGATGFEHEHVLLDVYADAKAGYRLRDDLTVTGKAYFGVISPIMGLLVGAPGSPLLSVWSGLEVAYRPHPNVTVLGDLVAALPSVVDFPWRAGSTGRASLSVLVNFGK